MQRTLEKLAAIFAESSLDRLFALAASLSAALFVLGGVVYAFRAAFSQGLVPPEVSLGAALCLGAAALTAGDFLWSRTRIPAAGLAGSGLGTLYLSVFVGHAWYGFFGSGTTLVLLLVVTAVGAAFAVRRDSQLMAALGFLSGMATPLLLSDGTGDIGLYFLYLGLLDCAVIYAAVRRRWVVLAWLSVLCTSIMRVAWGFLDSGPEVAGLASLSAALLGGLFAAGALVPGVARRIAVPFTLAALVALLALVPSVGQGLGLVSIGLPLVAVVGLMALLHGISARFRWPGLGMVSVVAGALGLVAMAARWALAGHPLSAAVLVAFVLLPVGSLWAVDVAFGIPASFERRMQRIVLLFVAGVAALAVGAVSHVAAGLPLVGLAIAGASWLIGVDRIDSGDTPRLVMSGEGHFFPPLGLLLAAGCLAVADSPPVLTVAIGAVLFVSTLLAPLAISPTGARAVRFLPALVAPVLVVPLHLGWTAWVGSGVGGLLALALATVAVIGVWASGSEWMAFEEEDRRMGQSVYLVVALLFASLAVPLQLEREWLTVGWALEGAALAYATRTVRQPVIQGAALLLLGLVAVRLVLNPAVMTYHAVLRPTVWNWILYGYGVPAAALFAAARWIELPRGGDGKRPLIERDAVRQALEWAGLAVLFAMLNLQVSHAFAAGGELTLWDVAVRAQVGRTLCWAAFGLGLLAAGFGSRHVLRWVGVALLGVVVVKFGVSDLWSVSGFARPLLLFSVSPFLLLAAAILQRPNRVLAGELS